MQHFIKLEEFKIVLDVLNLLSINLFSGHKIKKLILILFLSSFTLSAEAINVRIKDITKVQGLRDQYLIGYGLVTGLPSNSGDKNSLATNLAQLNLLKNFGVNIQEFLINNQVNVNNINMNNLHDMNNRNSTSKRKEAANVDNSKTRKKREELSISAVKSVKKEEVEIVVKFC
jgi:galactokinase/mevalonate kinase-like predicted kinase